MRAPKYWDTINQKFEKGGTVTGGTKLRVRE